MGTEGSPPGGNSTSHRARRADGTRLALSCLVYTQLSGPSGPGGQGRGDLGVGAAKAVATEAAADRYLPRSSPHSQNIIPTLFSLH